MREIKRGYVKWTDSNGVTHKEPLVDHPELLAKASPRQQLAAEEVRRLNEEGERRLAEMREDGDERYENSLEALQAAPEYVLTADQLAPADVDGDGGEDVVTVPASAAEEPVVVMKDGDPVKDPSPKVTLDTNDDDND